MDYRTILHPAAKRIDPFASGAVLRLSIKPVLTESGTFHLDKIGFFR